MTQDIPLAIFIAHDVDAVQTVILIRLYTGASVLLTPDEAEVVAGKLAAMARTAWTMDAGIARTYEEFKP